MNVIQVIQLYQDSLKEIYHEGELSQLVFMAFEQVKKFSKTDLVLKRNEPVAPHEVSELERILSELKNHKPIQYVLGHAWFYGLQFQVNENVLIPRQETEELVDWILTDIKSEKQKSGSQLKLLDVCTGSGCIAIALKKNLMHAEVTALDVSEKALQMAKENAKLNETEINFVQADVLTNDSLRFSTHTLFDVIISNPPYILDSEKGQMKKKELDFEPRLAFFVKDEDPFIFYKRIAELALIQLAVDGELYFEINETKGDELVALLNRMGFSNVILRKDLNGKDRMIRALKSR